MAAYVLGSEVQNYIDAVAIDFGNPTDITNEQYEDLVIKSIRRVNSKIGTTFAYYTASSGIVPTPTERQGSLIVLQAECLLAKRRYATAASKGIRIKDGDTSIDTTGGFGGHSEIKDDVCGELKEAIAAYKYDLSGAASNGECIWHGNTTTEYDHDHGDGGYHTRDYDLPTDV